MSADQITPIIGVVPGLVSDQEIVRLRENYCQAVIAAGGAPIVLPVTEDVTVYEKLLPLADAFLLTGGSDVDPRLYGDRVEVYEPKSYAEDDARSAVTQPSPRRDNVEELVLNFAYQRNMPVLGICRGAQMLNVHFGGTLYQDLSDQMENPEDDESLVISHWQGVSFDKATHAVTIKPFSQLWDILNATAMNVNSMHHQGIRDLAPNMEAVAFAPDGLVEAIEATDRSFMIGVQWHPEFFRKSKRSERLFRAFIQYARDSHQERMEQRGEQVAERRLHITLGSHDLRAWAQAEIDDSEFKAKA